MRLTIPITGTVLREGSIHGSGELVGHPDDPIRPVIAALDPHVSWSIVDVDLDNAVMVVEVQALEDMVDETTGEIKKATAEEKAAALNRARARIEGKSYDELYAQTGKPLLKRPARDER
jgi:hypothetical protein